MKILLIVGIIFLMLLGYSAFVVAGEYDEQIEKEHRKEGKKDDCN